MALRSLNNYRSESCARFLPEYSSIHIVGNLRNGTIRTDVRSRIGNPSGRSRRHVIRPTSLSSLLGLARSSEQHPVQSIYEIHMIDDGALVGAEHPQDDLTFRNLTGECAFDFQRGVRPERMSESLRHLCRYVPLLPRRRDYHKTPTLWIYVNVGEDFDAFLAAVSLRQKTSNTWTHVKSVPVWCAY